MKIRSWVTIAILTCLQSLSAQAQSVETTGDSTVDLFFAKAEFRRATCVMAGMGAPSPACLSADENADNAREFQAAKAKLEAKGKTAAIEALKAYEVIFLGAMQDGARRGGESMSRYDARQEQIDIKLRDAKLRFMLEL